MQQLQARATDQTLSLAKRMRAVRALQAMPHAAWPPATPSVDTAVATPIGDRDVLARTIIDV